MIHSLLPSLSFTLYPSTLSYPSSPLSLLPPHPPIIFSLPIPSYLTLCDSSSSESSNRSPKQFSIFTALALVKSILFPIPAILPPLRQNRNNNYNNTIATTKLTGIFPGNKSITNTINVLLYSNTMKDIGIHGVLLSNTKIKHVYMYKWYPCIHVYTCTH